MKVLPIYEPGCLVLQGEIIRRKRAIARGTRDGEPTASSTSSSALTIYQPTQRGKVLSVIV